MLSEGSGQTLTLEATAGWEVFPGQRAISVQRVTGRVTGPWKRHPCSAHFFPTSLPLCGPCGGSPTSLPPSELPLSDPWQNLGPLQNVCVLSHV